jgi:hypothetical protein
LLLAAEGSCSNIRTPLYSYLRLFQLLPVEVLFSKDREGAHVGEALKGYWKGLDDDSFFIEILWQPSLAVVLV